MFVPPIALGQRASEPRGKPLRSTTPPVNGAKHLLAFLDFNPDCCGGEHSLPDGCGAGSFPSRLPHWQCVTMMPGQPKLPSVRRRHSGLIPNSRLVASVRVRPQRQQIPARRAPGYSRVRNIAKGQCADLLQATNEVSAYLKLFPGQLEHYFRNRRQLIEGRRAAWWIGKVPEHRRFLEHH
jgi:hypothetical protein